MSASASSHDPRSGGVCAVCEGALLLCIPRNVCPVQRSADRGMWGEEWSGLPQTLHGSGKEPSLSGLTFPPLCVCVRVQEEQAGLEIGMGDEVYVEEGGEMVSGKVVEVSSQTQYEVSFEDGSVCSNLSPGDIVVSNSYVMKSAVVMLSLSVVGSPQPSSTARRQAACEVERWSDVLHHSPWTALCSSLHCMWVLLPFYSHYYSTGCAGVVQYWDKAPTDR